MGLTTPTTVHLRPIPQVLLLFALTLWGAVAIVSFVFDGQADMISHRWSSDSRQLSRYRHQFPCGTGGTFSLQISLAAPGENLIDLNNNPFAVLQTPPITVTPAAASVILVRPDIGGNVVGKPITDVAGNPLRVRIVDENGNPVAGREVQAQIIAGDPNPATFPDTGSAK